MVVVDANAVIPWVQTKTGYMPEILPHAVIAAPNLIEVLHGGSADYRWPPEQIRDWVLGTGVAIENRLTDGDAVRAAHLILASKARPGPTKSETLSLGDAACIAVAERLDLPILTTDPLFARFAHVDVLDTRTLIGHLRGSCVPSA